MTAKELATAYMQRGQILGERTLLERTQIALHELEPEEAERYLRAAIGAAAVNGRGDYEKTIQLAFLIGLETGRDLERR